MHTGHSGAPTNSQQTLTHAMGEAVDQTAYFLGPVDGNFSFKILTGIQKCVLIEIKKMLLGSNIYM